MASILIAEDRAVDRSYLATLLGYQGHGILEAADGAEALALVERNRPQLVISDILMPTMDGYEFVRRMRAIPVVAATPVIFYTATYHEREARALAARYGVQDIITKPSEPEVILAKVNAVLGRPRASVVTAPADPAQLLQTHLQLVNQKLNEKVQSLADTEARLSALLEIGRRISLERDPRGVLQQVCTSARELTLARHVTLALLSDDGGRVETVMTSGADASRLVLLSQEIANADALALMIAKRLPIRGRTGAAQVAPIRTPEDSSYLAVPIATASGGYGCLTLTDKLGADDFTDADERMAVALAAQASLAYENARHVLRLEQEVAERTRVQGRMDFALAAARMGIAQTDLDTGRVVWSDSTAALFGIAPESFAGTTDAFYALVAPDDRAALREALAQALRNGVRDLVTEFRIIWPDGSAHWLQTRARITYDPAGRALRVIDVSLDVTDRKRLEEQFRQAQKMEALGQLASGIAHDFNNLLTVISGYSEFVRDGLPPGELRSDAEQVIQAAQLAAVLTGQLLAFSRKQVWLPTRLDVNAVVANVSTMLKRLIGDHIELTTALAPALAPVLADAGQLEQVLINLVVNARDAMPAGGRITIATSSTRLDADTVIGRGHAQAGTYVVLTVSDTGVGMDQPTRDRLFEPFFTTKAPGKGTGLGLAAVHGIVTQSGGYVAVDSDPRCGTSFTIYFPAAVPGPEALPAVTSRERPGGGTASVLIVDDDHAVRTLTRTMLERAGYKVLIASSFAAAVALVAEEPGAVDVLVTDLALPDGTGPALFHLLLEAHPLLRVLYTSGYVDETVVDRAALELAGGLLSKPFLGEALVRKVRETLER